MYSHVPSHCAYTDQPAQSSWEPPSSFGGSEHFIDKFWGRVTIGERDWRDISQFKTGEVVFPTGPPRMLTPLRIEPVLHCYLQAGTQPSREQNLLKNRKTRLNPSSLMMKDDPRGSVACRMLSNAPHPSDAGGASQYRKMMNVKP